MKMKISYKTVYYQQNNKHFFSSKYAEQKRKEDWCF